MNYKTVTLEDISEKIDYGLTTSATSFNTGIKFLRITDIQASGVDWQSVPFCECDEKDLKQYSLASGDIVFARTGATTGKSFLIKEKPEKTVFASYLIRVRANQELVDPEFLSYLFQTPQYWQQISDTAVGAAQVGVNGSKLSNLKLPLPPLNEQKRIAALLERADRLRQLRRTGQELGDGLLQSVFLEMFGDFKKYDKILFDELATKSKNSFTNGPFGSNLLTTELVSKGVPVIYIRDIRSGYYQRVSEAYVTPQKANELDACRADGGDVLIAKVGDPPGTAAVYPINEPAGIVSQDVIRIKPNRERIHPEYLVKFLNSDLGYKVLQPILVEGTRERFGLTPMKQLAIPVPPLSLQEEFASVVRRVEGLRGRMGEAERQVDGLFEGLLAESFG